MNKTPSARGLQRKLARLAKNLDILKTFLNNLRSLFCFLRSRRTFRLSDRLILRKTFLISRFFQAENVVIFSSFTCADDDDDDGDGGLVFRSYFDMCAKESK